MKVISKNGQLRGVAGFVPRGVSTFRPEARSLLEAAFWAGVAHGGGPYWPELSKLTTTEKAAVRIAVASHITYLCMGEPVKTAATARLLALSRG